MIIDRASAVIKLGGKRLGAIRVAEFEYNENQGFDVGLCFVSIGVIFCARIPLKSFS